MKLSKNQAQLERFTKMNAEELAAATAEYDEEFVAERFQPLTPEQRARWERAKRRGRPTVGKGAKTISVSIEEGLLDQADKLARTMKVTRSKLLADSLVFFMQKSPRAANRRPAVRSTKTKVGDRQ